MVQLDTVAMLLVGVVERDRPRMQVEIGVAIVHVDHDRFAIQRRDVLVPRSNHRPPQPR
jgi:hypothetical protein